MFVALRGANFNGNEFAIQALEQGAMFAVVDEELTIEDPRVIKVENTLVALQQLANHHRRQFTIPIIGITGSNGKTSSKELIAAVLERKYKVLATKGNLNNHIGVPLTILQLTNEHEIAVIEMGANKFKDIEELCDIAEPGYGIITNIGKAHLEGFLNFEGVLKTKTELYTAVKKNKGTIFQNADDSVLTSNLPQNVEVCSYGTKGQNVLVTGELIKLTPFVHLRWTKDSYDSKEVETKMIGEYNFYNFLSAICIGTYFGVPANEINIALGSYESTNQRSQVQKTDKNTLIVDCYNANPSSMASALSSFLQIDHPSKLAILGDMREMGAEEDIEHQKIIDYTTENEINSIFVGPVFSKMLENKAIAFSSTEQLNVFLSKHTIENHLVLLKGSRGIALEKAIEKL